MVTRAVAKIVWGCCFPPMEWLSMTTRGWPHLSKEEFIICINGLLPVVLAPGRRPPLVAKNSGEVHSLLLGASFP